MARIAVSGPSKQTFSYCLPAGMEEPDVGQRVVVGFGRSRKLGFYLGPAAPVGDFQIRPVEKVLDSVSYFNQELLSFCLWLADYYFANPADCLAAALPAPLRSRRAVKYSWHQTADPAALPPSVRTQFRAGRLVSAAQMKELRQVRGLLGRLLNEDVVVEQWTSASVVDGRSCLGFEAAAESVWEAHFEKRRFRPQRFQGIASRPQLRQEGWSDHQIRQARQAGVLGEVFGETDDAIMSFISPRQAVSEHQLTTEQDTAVGSLIESLDEGFVPSLIHGVTGSGKTLVYCHFCREVLKRGRTVLVLTPEIALSGTTLAYFRGFFGDIVTVIHSAMTERERLQSWRGIRSGKYRIVVGPRSAVFAPLVDLGAIVVDEEHDSSYKQDDPAPRFHGRDAAIMRAKMAGVPIVLGSASPSFESYHHALNGRYRLLHLDRRPAGATLPKVTVVDMRSQRLRGELPFFSLSLKKGIEKCLENDEQVILFLNRRGHSPLLKCTDCGHVPQCTACGVNLTYHRVGRRLTCHYCGHVERVPESCPGCGGHEIEYLGAGTQKVEESLPVLFSQARMVRLDSDTAGGRKRAHRILQAFAQRKYELLLGTQMVAKGLDFPDVTLVGVLAADLSMDLPDFRASERTFSRLLQVAGRSGRAGRPGQVLIQTYYPESALIKLAAAQDYVGFYQSEIDSRQALSFPPFSHLVSLTMTAKTEEPLKKATADLAARLREWAHEQGLELDLLGPAPCPLHRLQGRYRRRILLKTSRVVALVRGLTAWEERQPRFGLAATVRIVVDVDPDDLM
ncbi:MAG: primosomal protein N' [bacterium]